MRLSLDANVLIYTVQAGDRRQAAALGIVEAAARADCVLTLQALGEFFVVAARKGLLERPRAAELVRGWMAVFPTAAATSEAVAAALAESEAGRFSYWDALLLATAGRAGCGALVSEDMAEGTSLAGARVVAAFAPGGGVSPGARAVLGLAAGP